MTVLDPVLDPLVALLAVLATGAQLSILLSLHRQDGEPFVVWSIVAWGARFAYFLIPLARPVVALDPSLWPSLAAATSGASSLAFLGAGLAYRARARPDRRLVLAGAVLSLGLGALAHGRWGSLEVAGPALAGVETLALGGAGAAFWPGEARRVRGAGLLAGCLFLWAAVRLAFDLPLGPRAQLELLPLATVVLVVQMTALVIVVLRGAQQRVEFLKAFNDRLIDGMDLGLTLVDRGRRVRHANRWMTERFGGDLPGRTCLSTYLAAPTPCASCPWREGAPGARQFLVDAAGGRKFLLTCSPLALPDGEPVLLELLSDVTDQEALRARLLRAERLAVIGEMASRVAHEVRNPLGVMAVHLDLVRRALGGAADEARHHLAVVGDEIRTVSNLVEAYLRLGRLPPPAPRSVDLEALIEARLQALGVELDVRDIRVERAGPALPAVWADPEQLGMVLANVIRNAIEAMPRGGTLTIRTGQADGTATVEVADTGPGVPPEQAEAIFQPFHTTKPHGTGLGLAVARQIAEEHGGTLTCRPRTGGASFVLALPAAGPS
jgi:signal transduction histidine kinase